MANKYKPIQCDDRLITHLVISQFSNGFDVHVWVSDEPFEFGELWGIVVSDELQPAKEDPVNTCDAAQKQNSYLVNNKNLIVNFDGKVVCLDDDVVLGVRVYWH